MSERDRLATLPAMEAIRWAGRDRERLKLVADARGYKRGWIYYRLREPRNDVL
jgi:hypothetical protein